MSNTVKRDTNADLMKGVLKLVKENGWYDEAESIMDYFLPEDRYVKELTNYEFDFKAVVSMVEAKEYILIVILKVLLMEVTLMTIYDADISR